MDVGRIWAFLGCGISWVCCSCSAEKTRSFFRSSGLAFLFLSSGVPVLLSFFPLSFSQEICVPLYSSGATPACPQEKADGSAPRNR